MAEQDVAMQVLQQVVKLPVVKVDRSKFWELYTSLHHQQHIVFMRISKKAASKRKSSFNNV